MRTKSTGLKIRNLGNDAFSVDSPSISLAFALFMRREKQSGKIIFDHVGDARSSKKRGAWT